MHVAEYKKSPPFKETALKEFWKGAQITLCSLVGHILEKSPLKYPLVRLAAALCPNTKKELNVVRFSKLMEKLVSNKRIDVKEGNNANQQVMYVLPNYPEMSCIVLHCPTFHF